MTDKEQASGDERPWWASDDPAGHHDEAASSHGSHTRPAWMDAVEAIDGAVRAAARGAKGAADRVADVRDGLGGQVDGMPDPRGDGSDGDAQREHRHGAIDAYCHLCPMCSLLRALDEVRPEVLVHLTQAARHLTIAAKAVIEAQADRMGPEPGVESIPVDD